MYRVDRTKQHCYVQGEQNKTALLCSGKTELNINVTYRLNRTKQHCYVQVKQN